MAFGHLPLYGTVVTRWLGFDLLNKTAQVVVISDDGSQLSDPVEVTMYGSIGQAELTTDDARLIAAVTGKARTKVLLALTTDTDGWFVSADMFLLNRPPVPEPEGS